MPYKYDASGALVVQEVDGKKLPVFVHGDGKESPFDAEATITTISRLNGEAKGHREAKEALEGKYKPFEGLDGAWVTSAKKALDIVKSLDDKKLIDAGEVERVRREATAAYEERDRAREAAHAEQLQNLEQMVNAAQSELYEERIGGAFMRSDFINKNFAIPADMARARFGDHFGIEEGRIYAVDSSGNKLYSRTKPGELAEFDEALGMLVDAYPYKNQILRGTGASGTGSRPNGSGSSGSQTILRKEFDALDPITQRTKLAEGVKLVDG